MKILLLVSVLTAMVGCEIEVRSGDSKNRFVGAGIVFEIPMETSDAQTGPDGINYESDRLSARTNGKELWVNGVFYGTVENGDVVDFYGYPEIRVNDTRRDPIEA